MPTCRVSWDEAKMAHEGTIKKALGDMENAIQRIQKERAEGKVHCFPVTTPAGLLKVRVEEPLTEEEHKELWEYLMGKD